MGEHTLAWGERIMMTESRGHVRIDESASSRVGGVDNFLLSSFIVLSLLCSVLT